MLKLRNLRSTPFDGMTRIRFGGFGKGSVSVPVAGRPCRDIVLYGRGRGLAKRFLQLATEIHLVKVEEQLAIDLALEFGHPSELVEGRLNPAPAAEFALMGI